MAAPRVAVEWTRGTLRLALAKRARGASRVQILQVETLGAEGEVSQLISAVLKKWSVRHAQAVGVIPRHQVISRVIKFPTVQPAELEQMVELYGRAQLPFPKEQVVVDYQVLEQREGFSTVGVVGCGREVIERHLRPLRDAGLEVVCLTVSSWAVCEWSVIASRTAKIPEPVLVINRDEERTDLVLVRDGRLLLSRSVGPGVRAQVPEAEGFELLAQEVDRTLATAKKELPGLEARSLLLTGVGPLESWKAQVSDRFALPVAAIEPLQPLGVRASFGDLPVSPVVVGGSVCTDPRRLLNLNPPEHMVQIRHRRTFKELAIVGTLALAVLGMGGGLGAIQVWRHQRVVSQVDQALSQMEPLTREVKAKAHAVTLVTAVLSQRRQLATLLAEVFRVTPAPVALTSLTFERARHQLILRGRGPSTEQVLAYLERLEQLADVKEVRLKHSTARSTPTGTRMDFELIIQPGRSSSASTRSAARRADSPGAHNDPVRASNPFDSSQGSILKAREAARDVPPMNDEEIPELPEGLD